MKKLLVMTILAGFTYFGATAQTGPGNSDYGHSHHKTKKAKKHYHVIKPYDAERRAVNERHKTSIRTIKHNDVLTHQQQKDMVKQANVTHKQDMRTIPMSKKAGKH